MRQRLLSILLAAFASLAAACGGDDSKDEATSSCRALCDEQGQATGCTNLAQYVTGCKALCDVLIAQLDADCRAKAKTAYDCQATLSYECAAGGNVPLPTTDGCQVELQAYSDCLGAAGE